MSFLRPLSLKKAILTGLPIVFILLVCGSGLWVFKTPSGAAWLWNRLENLEAVDVRSTRVSGDLASGFVVQGLEYRSEGLDLLVKRAEIEAGLILWPLSLRVSGISLQDVSIITRDPVVTDDVQVEGADIRTSIDSLKLPVPLVVDHGLLTHITLEQNGEAASVLAESVSFGLKLDEQLTVDRLEILTAGFESRLRGLLKLEPPYELTAFLEGQLERIDDAGAETLTLPFELNVTGDLDQLRFDIGSDKFGLTLEGQLRDPVRTPSWTFKALANQLDWPGPSAENTIVLSNLRMNSEGTINDWSFTLDSNLKAAQLHDARLLVNGSGSLNGLDIEHAILTGDGVDLGISGELDWSQQAMARVQATIGQLDLSHWLPDWPEGESLTGKLELNWSENRLEIPAGQLSVIDSAALVNVEANIDIESNQVNTRLDWSGLRWPLRSTEDGISSERGELTVSGTVDEWLAEGELDLRFGSYPQGRIVIQGGGSSTSARLEMPEGEILGGKLSGTANADWSVGLNWDAAIAAQGIDPEPLIPGWPGQLSSELEIRSQSESEQMKVNLVMLQGRLRGVPITASGGLEIHGSQTVFQSMIFNTDKAVLELNGDMADPAGAMIKFAGELPSRFLQGARGSVELEGRYSNNATNPFLELQLEALDLVWEDIKIQNLALNTLDEQSSASIPALQLQATGLKIMDQQIDELALTIGPAGNVHEIRANVISESVMLNSVMTLAPDNQDEPWTGRWSGLLDELEVVVGPAYSFGLSEPAPIAFSSKTAALGPVCLFENAGDSLCLELDYKSNGDWSVLADAKDIPLNYLRDILELDIHLEQKLDGHMEWHQPYGQAPTGGADFRISAGQIKDLLDNELLTETKEGVFAFKLQNGNLESGKLDIEFPGTGFIDIDFDVLDIIVDGSRDIRGRAVIRLDQIRMIGQLALPVVDTVDGKFEADIQLLGTLANPDFDGDFKLSNGFVHYAPVGLRLEDIEFKGQVQQRDRGDFSGQFRAGDGVANFDGRFLFNDIENVQMEVGVTGDQLLLLNTDQLTTLTGLDLKIAVKPQRIDINGKVTVPSARLTPDNLLLGEVTDSEDLVIETPGFEPEPVVDETTSAQQIFGQLEVAFGDDVQIKVPGIDTKLSGSTSFNWSGDPVPLAQGAYSLKGKVDIYGPILRISNGSISFPGVPADNPLLNIRAGRDIYGNTQIRSAGVQVVGNLKRPVLEAYTVPVTNEDRAWTLLITGTDFDQGQGVSGFDVGTYIAPKLYVSYGISLFDEENVVSARWDFKKGFGLKVSSGQRETGVDLSYTIDK